MQIADRGPPHPPWEFLAIPNVSLMGFLLKTKRPLGKRDRSIALLVSLKFSFSF